MSETTADGTHGHNFGDADPSQKTNSPQDTESWQQELPSFMRNFERFDWILWGLLAASGIYGFALLPFRAMLLVDHPFLYSALSGSSLSVLALTAENENNTGLIVATVLVAAVSMVKFLPLFFLIGKRWGPSFIDYSFMGHPPLWFRKLENFIYRHPGFCLLLSYIPFSPIPATIIVVIAGIKRTKGWIIGAYVLVYAIALKCFYVYLGLTFGATVRETLVTIERYVTWITFALLGYMFFTMWLKSKRKKARLHTMDDAQGLSNTDGRAERDDRAEKDVRITKDDAS
ncbi:DedA family protein [Corynebacterium pseudodiphtheriticum]|uniref:DedA family protein n=1 Tax=Corynebacterium pseudodiphtheriticum TaxID=37637 RepID=UPI003B63A9B4